MAALVSECYAQLQPSPAVLRRLEAERLAPLSRSLGVYMEGHAPPCGGCEAELMPNCTARRIFWAFLRDPTAEATVAGNGGHTSNAIE